MRRPRPIALALAVSALLGGATAAWQTPPGPLDIGASAFESYLELLRQQSGIPAISGTLIQDRTVVWERGLGFANVESRVRATPDTPYLVADLTQVLSSALLLQCVEQRRLDLDAPLGNYVRSFPEPALTLRQALSHSAPSNPGSGFRYDPERFARLTAVMEFCAPQPFRKSVAHRVLEWRAMVDSVPGRDLDNYGVLPDGLFEPSAIERYGRVLERLAVPYRVDSRRRASRSDVPVEGINAATGLVTTVRDLARLDMSLDAFELLREDTQNLAWSPVQFPDRAASPAGLGWFVQNYRGTKVVWQAGVVAGGYSALIVKVPARHATMILLANSDGLVVPSQFESGDVTRSLFSSLFLRMLL
jgi:CubicO group peptidase (beta-lactamase class C family)